MSRPLSALLFALTVLTGCSTAPPPQQEVAKPAPELVAYTALQQWLTLQQQVTAMRSEEVVAELVKLHKPQGADQLFYFALLNQQLQTYASWTQARDALRTLQEEKELTAEQLQLAGILQQYNQNRINWYQRQAELLTQHQELREQLDQAEQDKLLLEQKIQALTDLEADISTRKEQ